LRRCWWRLFRWWFLRQGFRFRWRLFRWLFRFRLFGWLFRFHRFIRRWFFRRFGAVERVYGCLHEGCSMVLQ